MELDRGSDPRCVPVMCLMMGRQRTRQAMAYARPFATTMQQVAWLRCTQ
jgi:hypothetical protein